MFFKIYSNSALATIVSIAGWACIFGAVASIASGVIPAALICAVLGALLIWQAKRISQKKQCKTYCKQLSEQGYEQQIRLSDQVALQVYNNMPCPTMLQYIEELNPSAGAIIRNRMAAGKSK